MQSGGGSRRYLGRQAGWGALGRAETERVVWGIDPQAASCRVHEAKPLSVHLEAWRGSLSAAGGSEKHVDLFTTRAHRVVALLMGARLSEIEPAKKASRSEITLAAANLAAAVR